MDSYSIIICWEDFPSPLGLLWCFTVLYLRVYFWAVYSLLMVYVSVFNLFFFRIALHFLVSFSFHIKFKIHFVCKKACWDYDWDGIGPRDQFESWYINNIEYPVREHGNLFIYLPLFNFVLVILYEFFFLIRRSYIFSKIYF